VDNLQDKDKSSANQTEENNQDHPEPIMQASDDSSRPREEAVPAEIMPGTKKRASVTDATLLPAQFMGMRGAAQPIPSVGDIIRLMLRFKWTILIVFILAAAPAITVIWTQIVPVYQAQGEVRVRPIIPYLVFKSEENGAIPLYDSFVNTQVSNIQKTTVLQRVLEQQEVQQTQWCNPPKSLLNRLTGRVPTNLDRLKDNLSAKPRRGTELIDVTFTDSNAKDAQLIVNTVLEQYMKYIMEMSDETQSEIKNTLAGEFNRLDSEIRGSEKVIATLRQQLGTATPEELISRRRVRLDETQAHLDELNLSITLLEWEKERIDANDSNNVLASAADKLKEKPKYFEDEEWRRLDNNVRTIQHNIDTSLLTPNNPDANKAKKELKFAKEQLERREQQLDELWQDRLNNPAAPSIAMDGAKGMTYEEGLIYLEYQLAKLKQEKQLEDNKFKKEKADFDNLFQTAENLSKENNDLQHTRELFDAVRQRMEQKNMEQHAPGSIEVETQAIVPTRHYNDRRAALTAMVLVMALGAGGGLAYLRANKTQAIYTPRDMPYPMQAPLLGYIPITYIRKLPVKSLGDQITQTQFHLIESVRIVRTALLSRLNGRDSTTLLVTSANAGTGKSAFSMMLGKSLAKTGKNVLIIDSDFHKMSLTKQFRLSDKAGLMESLRGSSIDKKHIFPTETPGLSFMPAGKQGLKDVEFEEIANGAFSIFINKLRKKYNIILLDSPPVLPVADAAILSGQLDGTIIVERELVSRRANIIDALARLDSAGGRVLGTVFLGSSENEKYGYGYHYGKAMQS
jgi:succinoglycan biosynthesis transport protein ExoP